MLLDLYLPEVHLSPEAQTRLPQIPAVIYFHGGGMTVGDRKSWFPLWLQQRINSAGIAFISTDYSLLPPASGHQIVRDIQDLFGFLSTGQMNDCLKAAFPQTKFLINPNALAVAGSSAGGLCSYLAAIHASPRPIALLSMYGMGGDFLTPHYLIPKSKPFFRGREILDPQDYEEFLYPRSESLPKTHCSPLAYHDKSYVIPGFPANPRMLLSRLYLQMGTYLDYWTGDQSPSVSSLLRDVLERPHEEKELEQIIPSTHRGLFPQFNVSSDWPPSFLCHGSDDSAVPLAESQHIYDQLQKAGASVQLEIVQGKEHSFDYEFGAERIHGDLFDRISRFLVLTLSSRETGCSDVILCVS
ncbi:hypothetical protein PLEOSDRAFT_1045533 [Pleurotus ostreatus PC15]|uniref:Alpha/beta hydrolase fold-3 domain-containing protein n=1 Tax=Pleurotus ostreatus (strain PC15) TaxID=1137138 RepID=A0A067NCW0_PLEO1|nr:hypothetical protein PLEOSDRAFT_1045533 [Pleurotus ostreatus PC15]